MKTKNAMLTQNLKHTRLSSEQLATLDAAIAAIRSVVGSWPALAADQKKRLRKMGRKQEPFCRQVVEMLGQNAQLVPPSVGLAEVQADLQAHDTLRPRLRELGQLVEVLGDNQMGLGSNLLTVALQGYGLLKLVGHAQGLEPLRRELSGHFSRSARTVPEAPPA